MARQTHSHLCTFDALEAFLNGKAARKIKNNTRAIRHDADTIGIVLHDTEVLTFTREWDERYESDGVNRYQLDSISLDSGGYQTVTTKSRMNEFLPARFGVTQDNWDWYVIDRNQPNPWSKDSRATYRDGMTLELAPVKL